eukprot:1393333-Amorphochlora_amoeboformis.AAC.1
MRPKDGSKEELVTCIPDNDCVIPDSDTGSLQMTAVASYVDRVSTEAKMPMSSYILMSRFTGKGELALRPECSNIV